MDAALVMSRNAEKSTKYVQCLTFRIITYQSAFRAVSVLSSFEMENAPLLIRAMNN